MREPRSNHKLEVWHGTTLNLYNLLRQCGNKSGIYCEITFSSLWPLRGSVQVSLSYRVASIQPGDWPVPTQNTEQMEVQRWENNWDTAIVLFLLSPFRSPLSRSIADETTRVKVSLTPPRDRVMIQWCSRRPCNWSRRHFLAHLEDQKHEYAIIRYVPVPDRSRLIQGAWW